jgi:hypothetical protein
VAAPWLLLAVAAVGLLAGRVVYSSRAELAAGLEAYGRGDRAAAVVHLRRAAHYYAPASPYVVEALEQLRRIGRQAEMEGQTDLALSAYRAIRTSCLGTRSFYTPHEDRLEEANRRIAAIMSRQDRPPMDRGKTVDQLRAEHYRLLAEVEAPDPLWSAVACLAFLAWIGGAFGFILRATDSELHLRRRPAILWGSVVVAGLVAWVVGLLLA